MWRYEGFGEGVVGTVTQRKARAITKNKDDATEIASQNARVLKVIIVHFYGGQGKTPLNGPSENIVSLELAQNINVVPKKTQKTITFSDRFN